MALEDRYHESILEMTKSPMDEILLTNRPLFRLNNSKPVIKIKTKRLLERIEFKKNPPTKSFDLLDEPLTNSYFPFNRLHCIFVKSLFFITVHIKIMGAGTPAASL